MFDFGNSNNGQKEAISSANGPVLITAGPGTGKTYTLVQRAIYLIEECGVQPENLFIATFTEKAAKELITRITNELARRNITANVNEMYVGTFHSLCLRILKENLEYTRLKKNYRLLDAFDQKYTVFQNIYQFRNIPNVDAVLPDSGAWKQSEAICGYVNNLSEELVSPDDLERDVDPAISAMGTILRTYQKLLNDNNLMDFSSIQVETYRLLTEHSEILEELQTKITHLMVDEYQDTNYIQEQLVFLLAGKKKNICVVGDDDQGLYRFRGATIRNILEFPQKFNAGECKVVSLVVNYRSNTDIVDFYNTWMATTEGAKFKFQWGEFRYNKKIVAHTQVKLSSPAVVKLSGVDDEDEWHENILKFIHRLKDSGKLTDYNQIAFLFSSVKHPKVKALADFLEKNQINVYSPRSDMFFERYEVRLTLGCLMLMFPRYVQGLENGDYSTLRPEHITYYRQCIMLANEHLLKPENKSLLRWIRQTGRIHVGLQGTTDYAYSGLLYQLFEYQPFQGMLDTDLNVGVVDIRPSRNLAKLSQIIGKFEYLHRVDTLNGKYININALFDVTAIQKTEDRDVVLLREPKDAAYYEFSAKDDLVITNKYPGFTPDEVLKSFHADTYCFDSLPEKECFFQYIKSDKVQEVYFTGMFTSNQGDLSVYYYDPESGRIRQYYPDFLAKMKDGTYQLIEVKGDNKIDDVVVQAKKEAALEMAAASGIKYEMYAGSTIMKTHILEDPPVHQTSLLP